MAAIDFIRKEKRYADMAKVARNLKISRQHICNMVSGIRPMRVDVKMELVKLIGERLVQERIAEKKAKEIEDKIKE